MHRKWHSNSPLHLLWVLVITAAYSYTASATDPKTIDGDSSKSPISSSAHLNNGQLNSISSDSIFGNETYIRSRRAAAVQASLRLIDEKQCPEIRNLCTNLRDGADDLPVLECVQTFLSNQIENLSDECQHAIWTHTGNKPFFYY